MKPVISICIPVYNQLKYTKQILENIKLTISKKYSYEIIILDDWSSDWTKEWLMYDDHIEKYWYGFKSRKNKGVTKTWNELVSMAKWEYIVVINNDILFQKDWDLHIINALQGDVWMCWPVSQYWDVPFYWPIIHKKEIVCGWCWAFKGENKNKIFPIDERVKIRYNDDFLWAKITQWLGKQYKIVDTMLIHHFWSCTLKHIDFMPIVKKDKEFYILICKENGRKTRTL